MKTKTIGRHTARNPDEARMALHVPRFKKVRLRHVAFSKFLETGLKEITRKHAPMAIVNARPKSIPSPSA